MYTIVDRDTQWKTLKDWWFFMCLLFRCYSQLFSPYVQKTFLISLFHFLFVRDFLANEKLFFVSLSRQKQMELVHGHNKLHSVQIAKGLAVLLISWFVHYFLYNFQMVFLYLLLMSEKRVFVIGNSVDIQMLVVLVESYLQNIKGFSLVLFASVCLLLFSFI